VAFVFDVVDQADDVRRGVEVVGQKGVDLDLFLQILIGHVVINGQPFLYEVFSTLLDSDSLSCHGVLAVPYLPKLADLNEPPLSVATQFTTLVQPSARRLHNSRLRVPWASTFVPVISPPVLLVLFARPPDPSSLPGG